MENIYFIGRIILGVYFLYNAYNHFANVDSLAGYAASKKVPMPRVAILATGVMLFIGGAAILTGMSMVIGLWILVAFLIATSFVMHPYWKITDPTMKMGERIAFQKNMAIMGALLMIIALV